MSQAQGLMLQINSESEKEFIQAYELIMTLDLPQPDPGLASTKIS